MWVSNCTVIDVEDPDRSFSGSLRIDDGTIVESSENAGPRGAGTVDLGGRYLMPGLITCHVHLTEVYPFDASDGESPATSALRARAVAEAALLAGVTTIRCVHETNRADLHLRHAHAHGWAPNTPRIFAAGQAITTTGGHGDGGGGCVRADGPEEFLHAAREELAAGADHIKIFISGGIGDASENLSTVQMTLEEMRAVVGAADEHGAYVVAHAGHSASIQMALEAGVRSFEHAYELDDETDGAPAEPVEGTFMAAIEAELMSDAGIGPVGALRAATVNAARLLGAPELGTTRVGGAADLIAMPADPTADIRALREIDWVMSRGAVVRTTEVS